MTTWTDERVQTMRARWAEGKSAGEIARELGGVSRNAVIGKLHRLGIAGRGMALPQREHKLRVRTARDAARRLKVKTINPNGIYKLQPLPAEPMPEPSEFDDSRRGQLVHLLDLEPHHCRFAIGYDDRLGHGFCGCTAVPGLPYCDHHAGRVYTPVEAVRPSRRGLTHIEAGDTTTAGVLQEFLQPA